MRLPATGFTLPWQLVAAQDPGPIYFPGSGVSVDAECAGSKQRHNAAKIIAARAKPGWGRIPIAGYAKCLMLYIFL